MKTYKKFMEEAVDKRVAKLISKYKKHKTDDYQRRGGSAPTGGIPDDIAVGGWRNEFFMEFMFKDTSPKSAETWVKRLLGSAAKTFRISSHQEGDYHNDWVKVSVEKVFE